MASELIELTKVGSLKLARVPTAVKQYRRVLSELELGQRAARAPGKRMLQHAPDADDAGDLLAVPAKKRLAQFKKDKKVSITPKDSSNKDYPLWHEVNTERGNLAKIVTSKEVDNPKLHRMSPNQKRKFLEANPDVDDVVEQQGVMESRQGMYGPGVYWWRGRPGDEYAAADQKRRTYFKSPQSEGFLTRRSRVDDIGLEPRDDGVMDVNMLRSSGKKLGPKDTAVVDYAARKNILRDSDEAADHIDYVDADISEAGIRRADSGIAYQALRNSRAVPNMQAARPEPTKKQLVKYLKRRKAGELDADLYG